LVQANASAVQDAQRQLELKTSRALQSVKKTSRRPSSKRRTLSPELEAAKADAQDLSREERRYNVMEREPKSNRSVTSRCSSAKKSCACEQQPAEQRARGRQAEIPKSPLAASGRRTWIMSPIGLVLAVGVAFGLDYMNDTIKTPEDVTRRLEAAVPRPRTVRARRQAIPC